MNLTITELRTRLTIENISDLMFISINGPLVEDYSPQQYVKVCLQDHWSVVSAPCGVERKETDEKRDKLGKKLLSILFKN